MNQKVSIWSNLWFECIETINKVNLLTKKYIMINKESLLSSSSLTETDETPKIEQDECTTAKLIIGSI